MLCKEAPGDVVNIFGFRAEESPARAKRKVFARNARASTQSRTVWDWLPIFDWTEQQVWKDIRDSGVPYHWAYDKGMPRLSCTFCIFAPRNALLIAGRHNPELLARYVDVEKKIGHTFRQKQSLAEIQSALAAGEQPGKVGGAWNM
jgi:3'-phosphoadenosine 5'-phosphosulfate sulfotransferase (PAPS reductase)/FAD synthetase